MFALVLPRDVSPNLTRRQAACQGIPWHVLCSSLLVWLIVMGTQALASEDRQHPGRPKDTVEIFQCTFDQDWDVNYDLWPDRWIRQKGPNYPHYVKIGIREESEADQCLTLDLDGALGAVSSPPIQVMSRFSYVLDAKIKTENLNHSEVIVVIDFYNDKKKLLQTYQSSKYMKTDGWQNVRISSISLNDDTIDRAVISLRVLRGRKGDLHGRVSFDDIRLSRLPRMSLQTNSSFNVYNDIKDVVVTCMLSGIREQNPEIRFQLLDDSSSELHSGSFQLDGRLIMEDVKRASDIIDGIGSKPAGYEGSKEWRPEIPDYGFYRVVVKMLSSEAREGDAASNANSELDSREVRIAVVPPLDMPERGEFGWTLPLADKPLSFHELSQLLPQLGIHWLKLPAWYGTNEPQRGDDIVRFVELLSASNIETVGLIDHPPIDSDIAERVGDDATIADLLSIDPSVWAQSLDPVMSRLSLRVRWWQLGGDYDTSFDDYPNLREKIPTLRKNLYRFGQDVQLGLGWNWNNRNLMGGNVTWEFEQYSDIPSPSAKKLDKLMSEPSNNTALRWVLVNPPVPDESQSLPKKVELENRVSEFVHQIVVAKEHGADAIFVSNPFNDKNGLMRADGTPAELLLPWRTSAAMLSGSIYMGQLQLPQGSENRLFLREDGQVVMVIWNKNPTNEMLYLGEEIQHYDILGRQTKPKQKEHRQVIEVDRLPTFVLGLNKAITQMRIALRFEQNYVPSIFAVPHDNIVHYKNFFTQGIGGSVSVVVLQDENETAENQGDTKERHGFEMERWSIDPPEDEFRIAAGEDTQLPIRIRLKNALYGIQPVRVDFDLVADQHYKFSVFRTMRVGTGDVTLDITSHVDNKGMLVVKQIMTNHGDRIVDFKCYLYAKGHRRQRMQVYRLGPSTDLKIYRFPHGQELVGKELLLEAEEIGGPRVLKYRFLATEKAVEKEVDEEEDEEMDKSSLVENETPPRRTYSGANIQ